MIMPSNYWFDRQVVVLKYAAKSVRLRTSAVRQRTAAKLVRFCRLRKGDLHARFISTHEWGVGQGAGGTVGKGLTVRLTLRLGARGLGQGAGGRG
ncbi:hypothetical protein DYU11_32690 [Fibrisoma montanum]|uniref:Uncharacterized protein n=1 Tax=Fibrisoma montanum TaxID=2305895 RepID=A0A418LVK3_9BACT|nr:hypothetical protein DYU11_32690 [Fibrisoma montanum]